MLCLPTHGFLRRSPMCCFRRVITPQRVCDDVENSKQHRWGKYSLRLFRKVKLEVEKISPKEQPLITFGFFSPFAYSIIHKGLPKMLYLYFLNGSLI